MIKETYDAGDEVKVVRNNYGEDGAHLVGKSGVVLITHECSERQYLVEFDDELAYCDHDELELDE